MTTEEAKDRIFTRLCEKHKKFGSDEWVDRDEIVEELGIPLEIFRDGFEQMHGNQMKKNIILSERRFWENFSCPQPASEDRLCRDVARSSSIVLSVGSQGSKNACLFFRHEI